METHLGVLTFNKTQIAENLIHAVPSGVRAHARLLELQCVRYRFANSQYAYQVLVSLRLECDLVLVLSSLHLCSIQEDGARRG